MCPYGSITSLKSHANYILRGVKSKNIIRGSCLRWRYDAAGVVDSVYPATYADEVFVGLGVGVFYGLRQALPNLSG